MVASRTERGVVRIIRIHTCSDSGHTGFESWSSGRLSRALLSLLSIFDIAFAIAEQSQRKFDLRLGIILGISVHQFIRFHGQPNRKLKRKWSFVLLIVSFIAAETRLVGCIRLCGFNASALSSWECWEVFFDHLKSFWLFVNVPCRDCVVCGSRWHVAHVVSLDLLLSQLLQASGELELLLSELIKNEGVETSTKAALDVVNQMVQTCEWATATAGTLEILLKRMFLSPC